MTIQELYKIFQSHRLIDTDSRNIRPGSIFFALRGESFDGNVYANKSLELGSAYAVVDNPEYATNERCILVPNTLEALQQLANLHRKTLGIPIIAITGTNGKTTTKELVNAVLSKKYKTYSTQGNLNNHIGVPLTLLSMNDSTELGIVEMGANHIGEIKSLCNIAEPNMGLITNIGKAHLEGFGSFEGVVKTKTELYDFLELSKGTAFFNNSNPIIHEQINKRTLPCVSYGAGSTSVCDAKVITSNPLLSIRVTFNENNELLIRSNLSGTYNLENILAAFAIGLHHKIAPQEIKTAIEEYKPQNNRSQVSKTEANTLILDFYNANPTSMQASIENFAQIDAKNKVAILGDMLELGAFSQEEHRKIIDLLKEMGIPEIFLVGKEFNQLSAYAAMPSFSTVEELNTCISNKPLQNKFILIKGSRGIHLERIIPLL